MYVGMDNFILKIIILIVDIIIIATISFKLKVTMLLPK